MARSSASAEVGYVGSEKNVQALSESRNGKLNRVNVKRNLTAVCLEGNRMSIISRTLILVGLMLAVLVSGVGCGSGASNNDQGTSVTNVGFFGPDDDGTFPCELFESSKVIPLFTDFEQFGTPILSPAASGVGTFSSMGILNNLAQQTFRATRIDCDYDVPGSSIAIPSDAHPAGIVLAPTNVEGGATPGFAQFGCFVFEIVSPDLFSFLNNNINSLPQLPFRMNATCSVTGITQAGDTITTNPVSQVLQFYDVAEGNPPTFNQGPGTGGTFTTDGDNGGEDGGTTGNVSSAVATDDFEIQ